MERINKFLILAFLCLIFLPSCTSTDSSNVKVKTFQENPTIDWIDTYWLESDCVYINRWDIIEFQLEGW